jgi:hypothetical protein
MTQHHVDIGHGEPIPEGWYEQALAAIGEGFCPSHALALTPKPHPKGSACGWCPRCQAWWHISPEGDVIEEFTVVGSVSAFVYEARECHD